MLIPWVLIGISTQPSSIQVTAISVKIRTVVRRGFRPKSSERMSGNRGDYFRSEYGVNSPFTPPATAT